MRNQIIMLAVGCLLQAVSFAQPTLDQQMDSARSSIFRVKISYKIGKKKEMVQQTGFKLKRRSGLITALHGLAVPGLKDPGQLSFTLVRYTKNGTGRELKPLYDEKTLKFAGFDAERDLAYIECSDPDFLKLEGLTLAQPLILKGDDPVLIIGFPETNDLDGTPSRLKLPALDTLKGMISDVTYGFLKARNSPNPHMKVIKMLPYAASAGLSGGPVLNANGEVIGVVDGGFFNKAKDKVSSWAIPSQSLTDTTTMRIPNKDFVEIANHNGREQFFSAKPTKANIPLDLPLRTIGGTLSRPFILNAAKFDIDWDFRKLNAAFDAYWEKRFKPLGERNFFGIYLSSRFLQYRIVRKFAHGLPLQGEANLRDGPIVDRFGVQASRITTWGKRHNTYVGLGGFWLPNTPLLTNYRGFAGYRYYLTPHRRLGIELRAALLMYNVNSSCEI